MSWDMLVHSLKGLSMNLQPLGHKTSLIFVVVVSRGLFCLLGCHRSWHLGLLLGKGSVGSFIKFNKIIVCLIGPAATLRKFELHKF